MNRQFGKQSGFRSGMAGKTIAVAVVGAALFGLSAVAPTQTHAAINKVVPGHVGTAHSPFAVSSTYLFPLQTGMNKVTIQGNNAMATAKRVDLIRFPGTVKIKSKGLNHLHLNIFVKENAAHGKTGDGIIVQPVSKGTPDKFRWKIYKRGTVTNVVAAQQVQQNASRTITIQGKGLSKAELRPQPQRWTILGRTQRTDTSITYAIRFDKCFKQVFKPFHLLNEDLPPQFKNNVKFSSFLGKAEATVDVVGPNCVRPRIRQGAPRLGCPRGYVPVSPGSSVCRRI